MLAHIAPTARRSAVMTAAVAVVAVAISAAFAGHKGLLGAVLAVVIVGAFFGITVLALGKAAKHGAQAMMLAGIGTYTFKILVLIAVASKLQNSTAFSAWTFGLCAIVLVLVYDVTLAVTWSKRKMLYVEPDGER
jgi:ATP synthase protein I